MERSVDLSGGRLPTHAWGSHGSHVSPSAAPDIRNLECSDCVVLCASWAPCSSESAGWLSEPRHISSLASSLPPSCKLLGRAKLPHRARCFPAHSKHARRETDTAVSHITFGGDTDGESARPARQTNKKRERRVLTHSFASLSPSRPPARASPTIHARTEADAHGTQGASRPAASDPACPIHTYTCVCVLSEVEILLRDTPSPLGQTPYASTRQRCVSDLSPISRTCSSTSTRF